MSDNDAGGLPPPAAASSKRKTRQSLRQSLEGRAKKTTTFEQGGKKSLRVRWNEIKKIISTAVSLSDSPLDATVESTEASSFRAAVVRRESDWAAADDELVAPVEVDEVVVDAEWDLDKWANASTIGPSESAEATRNSGPQSQGRPATHSGRAPGSGRSQTGMTHGVDSSGIRELWGLTTVLRWRLYPRVVRFFDLSYYSAYQEDKYRKDVWFTQKKLAVVAAAFYFIILLLNAVLAARPFDLFNQITVIGGGLLFSVPVFVCVLFNVPRMKMRHQWLYQIILMMSAWSWGWYNMFDIWSCGFLASTYHPACGTKDFQLTSFYNTALPMVALFALGQNRFFHLLGVIGIEVLGLVLVLPYYSPWGRNFVNTTIFHALMLYVHFTLETAERRSFTLREQLKEQCRATQKAQVNERKESDSKKRFVSYIFHEVRVPLNTALLASQNLVGAGYVNREDDLEFSALEGSLKMMSKVLNDVLDFNRMDSGRFTTMSRPYCFHNAIRSMLLPLELSAKSRGLELTIALDPLIDEAANRAAYAPGEEYEKNSGREGMVLGDEMRLRQIVTNLTSNACKFTSEGGRVHVETKLILPQLSADPSKPPALLNHHSDFASRRDLDPEDTDSRPNSPVPLSNIKSTPTLSPTGPINPADLYTPMSGRSEAGLPHRSCIVVRIEVRDTGVGIRPRDLIDNRLFSPYVQTEIGRFQGGKGTGLGLALVRNIVKLSGGRLGVKSKVGEGSTFWVELALGVGAHAVIGRQAMSEAKENFYASRAAENNGNAPRFREKEGITIIDYAPRGPRPDTPLLDNYEGPTDTVLLQASQPVSREVLSPAPSDPLTESTAVSEVIGTPASEHPTVNKLSPPSAVALPAGLPQRPPFPPEESTLDTPSLPSESGAALRQTLRNASGADGPSLLTGSLPSGLPQLANAPSQAAPIPVLVVDDDLLTRRLMARMLARIGCTVDVAENGQVALDYLLGANAPTNGHRQPSSTSSKVLLTPSSDLSQEPVMIDEHKYAVVFLDNQMPVLSGVGVVSRLRDLGRTTFVVGVTGNALQEDQQEYLEAGVDRILTKPVLEKDLRHVVTIASERWKQQPTGPF